MRMIIVDGREVKAQDIEPLGVSENWNEYQMPNGDLLKVKLVLTRSFIAPELKNKLGETIYSIDYHVVIKLIPGKEGN